MLPFELQAEFRFGVRRDQPFNWTESGLTVVVVFWISWGLLDITVMETDPSQPSFC